MIGADSLAPTLTRGKASFFANVDLGDGARLKAQLGLIAPTNVSERVRRR